MSLYASAVDLFIRPHRAKYTLADLGPANISFASKRWHREDFVVPNDRGQLLHASWWRVSPVIPRPCVIYLHTNSGSRLEALDYLPLLMKLNISLLAFDFAGSGLSEGEYVTLGAWEKRDVGSILAYVLGTGQATSVALWGRSMGAATALLAADLHKRFVRAVVADSSFASLPRLVQDVTQGRSATAKALVNVLVSLGMKMIGETIKQRAHFRLADVDPLAAVEASPVPTLYMHADRDGFVLPEHSRDLHAKQRLENKRFVLFSGDHNGIREFLFDQLLTPEERATMVTIPRLNLISSSLYYVVRQLSPATALPATLQAKELPLVLHSPLVAAAHKNTLRLALIYSDEVVLEQAFNVATDLRWEEGGVVAFQVTRVVLPIPVRYAFASADARELYAMLAGAITPAPGGAPPPQPPPPASALTLGPAADGDSLRPDSWEAADPSFAQLRLPRRGLGESDQGPTRGARILSESDVHLLRPLSPQAPGGSPPAALVATSSSGDMAAVHAGTLEEAQRDELDAAVTALAATEQCVWGLSPDATLVWDSLTGALLERRRLTSEAATHLLCVGSQMWLFAPHLISVYAARLLEPVPDRAAALVALLPSAGRRDWRPMHVVLRSTELAVYRRREDLETAYRMPLKGATFQRSTHADHKFVLLVREAAPVGSKASALLGMSAEPLLLAARSDEELSAWHAAVAAACAAIDTGRCQFLRTAELGCRTVGAVVEAEGRVWVAAGERAVVRVFDAVSGAFRAEYLYIPPEHAPNELISCVCYHKEYMWAGLGRDIVRASPVDFGQRKSFSAGRSRVYHLVPQDNFLWSASSDALRQWSLPQCECVRVIDRSGIEPVRALFAPAGLVCVVLATSVLVLNAATGAPASPRPWSCSAAPLVAAAFVWWHDALWLVDAQGVRYVVRVAVRKPIKKVPAALFDN